jgi:aminoglycoside phosphotransferase (APT) family kinase protein
MAFTDEPQEVREGAALDAAALAPYLATLGLTGPIEIKQFGRGYSNVTYSVRVGERDLVLRRGPPGVKIASAHDMGREHKILSRLASVWPKVPKVIALCEDESVIGGPFYVMERVRGVILRAKLPDGIALPPERMKTLSEAMVDTLAEIHTVDLVKAGLADLGKPAGYNQRQVKGWSERYLKAQTDEIPEMAEVAAWLAANTPPESAATLIHNDFKYDNVVLSEALDRVIAVLDWEMSTIGDPLMDVGCALSYWVEEHDPMLLRATRFGPTDLPGNLTRRQFVDRWQEKTGLTATNMPFYYAFALFKLAVVAQQLYQRYAKGLTKEPRYAFMIEGVKGLSRAATRVIATGKWEVLDPG